MSTLGYNLYLDVRWPHTMRSFDYLLSEISVYKDPQWGPSVALIDWHHLDYIQDVFAEHFDIECEFKTDDDETRRYVLHFNNKATWSEVEAAINAINTYHAKHGKLYETI
jgi:hypothetical protein